jgi:3D (Asp-Asp-Asp) domain-containing protein
MLAIRKRASGKIIFSVCFSLVALIFITVFLGIKIYAFYEDETEEQFTQSFTVLSLAASVNNTQPPAEFIKIEAASPLTRVERAKLVTVPYSTIYKQSDTIEIGETLVIKEGENGGVYQEFLDTYVEDILKTVEMVSETVYPPEDEVVLVGTLDRNLPENMISELEIPEWFALDENGVPTEYSSVLTGKGVAYSARPGAKTASGRTAMPGYVAVDPSIIPYGTKMYIASTDNKHIYGYAIAADTGTGLLEGLCLVDLFMNSYEESCDWGAHQVNIYILE